MTTDGVVGNTHSLQLTVVVTSNTQEMGEVLDVVMANSVSVTSLTVTPSLQTCLKKWLTIILPHHPPHTSNPTPASLCSLATSARIEEENSTFVSLFI